MTTTTFAAIDHRHQPDSAESGRVCRACARPWPCDVRVLVEAMTRPSQRPRAGAVRRARRARIGAPA